jgi:2,3-bisphosphoglycerate-independent phosphoglycerate mutase
VSASESRRRLLYLVLDGLGDEPSAELGGRTPLEAACTPHMDALARDGEVFRLQLADDDGKAATHIGQFALLGYGPRAGIPHRGPVEAAATGIELLDGDVALRANLATLDAAGRIVDRRAGRIREGAAELCAALDEMDLGDGVKVLVRCATEHRAAVVLRGWGLGAEVTDSDPGTLSGGPQLPLPVHPSDPADKAAERTARKLEVFLARAQAVLAGHPVNRERIARGRPAANAILTRQAGAFVPLRSFEERFYVRCIGVAAERTVIGVLRLLGAAAVTRPEFTANTDTDLEAKFEIAIKLLNDDLDIVMLHVKATDILGHDQKPREKAAYVERIDAQLGRVLELLPEATLVALASDHSTSSTSGDHILEPVPAFLWGEGVGVSGVGAFDEPSLVQAGAPLLHGDAFFRRILTALGRGDYPD